MSWVRKNAAVTDADLRAHLRSSTDPRAERVRTSLLDAGLALMADGPIADISVSRLVETARVSRPAFYRHFEDLDDVLVSALRREMDAVVAEASDPADAARRLLRWIDTQRALHAYIHPSYTAQRGSDYARELLRPWCAELAAGITPSLPEADRVRAESFLLGGVLELMRQAYSKTPPLRVDADDLMRLTARMAQTS